MTTSILEVVKRRLFKRDLTRVGTEVDWRWPWSWIDRVDRTSVLARLPLSVPGELSCSRSSLPMAVARIAGISG